MKLVIAGSRKYDVDHLRSFLSVNDVFGLFNIDWPSEVIHGGCPTGTDAWAAYVMDEYWDITPTKVFNADWKKHGKAAGPIRNKQMAEYGDALLLIWDGESRGSTNMKKEMLKLDKPVYEMILKGINE